MSSNRETTNATIRQADLSIHQGMLTLDMILDYDTASQGIGAFVVYMPSKHEAGADILAFLYNLMRALKVECMSDLVGKIVRADSDHSTVYQIGHPVKDKWAELPVGHS